MMTREQLKQRRRIVRDTLAAASVAGVLIGCTVAGFDAEAFRSACAAVGAFVMAYAIVRWAVALDA